MNKLWAWIISIALWIATYIFFGWYGVGILLVVSVGLNIILMVLDTRHG